MPKISASAQHARRERILDHAERCFARAGFHRTTMQDICKAAEISPGAIYTYFDSKEALIAGLIERDRAKLQGQFAGLAQAPDFMAALAGLAEHYTVEEPDYKRALFIEMGAESTRNPQVAETMRSCDSFVRDSFIALLTRLAAEDRIRPSAEIEVVVGLMLLMGDGLLWRRAVDPGFDARTMLPALMAVIAPLVNPVPQLQHAPARQATAPVPAAAPRIAGESV